MTGYTYKITNAAGDFFYINDFVTDPLRFIALQDYPDMVVDVKNSEVAKEGQHGIFDFYSFYGKRAITLSGILVGTSEADVETLRTQFLKVLSLPANPTATADGSVTITWTDANGAAWRIIAKMQGYPRFTRGLRQGSRLLFNVTLKSKDPQIESQTVNTTNGVRGWQQGSLLVPAYVPGLFNLVYDKEVSISNVGAVPANTVITMYGEAGITVSNPRIFNETTGKTFKVNITLADATKYITIDSKAGTVIDQDGVDRSGLVDSLSEFIILAVGTNKLVYLSDESYGVNSPVNTWIEPVATFSIAFRAAII